VMVARALSGTSGKIWSSTSPRSVVEPELGAEPVAEFIAASSEALVSERREAGAGEAAADGELSFAGGFAAAPFSGSLEGADEMGFELLGTSSPEDCASGPGATARAALVLVTGEEDSLRSEEHTSELQSQSNLVCRLLLEKKKK